MPNYSSGRKISVLGHQVDTARLYILLLAFVYLTGSAGLANEQLRQFFLPLTPLTLIFSFICVLAFHKEWNSHFMIFLVLTFLSGFLVEAAGVATGLIFGSYTYGKTLGTKIFNTPVIIGINWLILIYSVGTTLYKVSLPTQIKCMAGALVLVILDFFIEPVAIELNFWSWNNHYVPVQNYIAWFTISFLLLNLFYKMRFEKRNAIAPFLLIIQFTFFIILNSYFKIH